MIKVKCKCGIYRFEFQNDYEKDHLQLIMGEIKDGMSIYQWLLDYYVKYSIAGLTIFNKDYDEKFYNFLSKVPVATKTYQGQLEDILEQNNLTFNIMINRIELTSNLDNKQINVNNKILGLLQCNNSLKAWNGFYDLDNNISIVNDYETY